MTPRAAGRALVFAAAIVPAIARDAVADEAVGTARLAWVRGDGAESCPDGEALARDVTERLGRNPFEQGAPQVIEGTVVRDGLRWSARLYVRDADGGLVGVREFASDAPTCATIGRSVALAIALTIDPDARLNTPAQPPAAPAPTPTPPPTPVSGPPVAPRPTRPRPGDRLSRSRTMSVVARAVGSVGLFPAVALGVGLGLEGTVVRRLRWHGGVVWYPEVRTSTRNSTLGIGMVSAAVGACADAVDTALVLVGGCVTAHLGSLHTVAYDFAALDPAERPWGALSFGTRVALNVGPFRFDVRLDLLVPFSRYRFSVRGSSDPVFEQSAVAGVLQFGAGASF